MLDTFTNEQVSDTARAATCGDACAGASKFAAMQTGVLVAMRVEIGDEGWRGAAGRAPPCSAPSAVRGVCGIC